MKKRLLLFLIASSLCTCSADAAALRQTQESRTLMELAAATPAPRPKITDVTKNGFFKENGKTKYYKKGKVHKGFLDLKGQRYYFNKKGEMVTGSQKIGGAQYYFDSNGVMKTGLVKIRSKRYYYDKKTGKKSHRRPQDRIPQILFQEKYRRDGHRFLHTGVQRVQDQDLL